MYLFLSHLSFVDVCSSAVIGPKMLTDILVEKKFISFFRCVAQIWLFGPFVVTECFLLASVAYERYMAICKPLLCTLMCVCVQLVVGPYAAMGLKSTMIHITFTFHLPCCGPNITNHFFCDLPVLSLACADTQVSKCLLFILTGALGVLNGVITLVSYVYVGIAILRIRSADGRRKAFSTCSSHLTPVSIL
ncbi:Olfactory receptor 1002 [Camelus dromedarius]|uniref:Olfactory receptor 1002 n=2 Tax=Camelus dromedarius TaxID=9838 RepID=A0A5N4DPJ8_CAMDR|nr:Olfactory receptor 1002 [Camelus dromedarius]